MTPWGTAPGDAGERGGESERAQHPTVGGWGGGSGPVVEWERESGREKEEDSQCPKSADSLMKVDLSVLWCHSYVVCWLLLVLLF